MDRRRCGSGRLLHDAAKDERRDRLRLPAASGAHAARTGDAGPVMIWVMVPLLAFVLFGLYVRREAERLRAEDSRPRLIVKLKLAGSGMASREELRMRQTIEDDIEKRGIGSIADTGSGEGWAHIQVTVDDKERAFEELLRLIDERGISDAVIEAATTVR